jgi:hypothetical protein
MCDISSTVSFKAERFLLSLAIFIACAHDIGLDIKVLQTSQRDLGAGLAHHLIERPRNLTAINETRLSALPGSSHFRFALML